MTKEELIGGSMCVIGCAGIIIGVRGLIRKFKRRKRKTTKNSTDSPHSIPIYIMEFED
jgi:hypothetical protein